MTQRSVLFRELRAPELRDLARPDTVVMLPVASMEQHGPHLPVGTDSMLGHAVCERAAKLLVEERPALVMDTIWTGLSEHHMAFGGTVTLDFSTFHKLIHHICRSLQRHGFRRIALINSHGGNISALQTITEEITRDLDLPIVTATYWTLAQHLLAPHLLTQKGIRHACEAETSMVMHLFPDLVDRSALAAARCPDARDHRADDTEDGYRWLSFAEKSPSGALGDPTVSTAGQGEVLLDIAAAHLARRLADPSFWGPRAGD
ncbi:MAG: creatininase family protein [Geminicoccaceae bacterium]|nr:creatininase family protein [Geminicoccaceae bacterium]MCB2010998.1 creatininase family protein [Geminicoccaceae bacterium]